MSEDAHDTSPISQPTPPIQPPKPGQPPEPQPTPAIANPMSGAEKRPKHKLRKDHEIPHDEIAEYKRRGGMPK